MGERRQPKYSLLELAGLAGVAPRTVRYYLTERLVPAPLGRGRGRHYDDAHLNRLRKIRYYQSLGMELEAIRRLFENHYATGALDRGEPPPMLAFEATAVEEPAFVPALAAGVGATHWTRLELAPGFELHVAGEHRLPPVAALGHLAAECRALFGIGEGEEHDAD